MCSLHSERGTVDLESPPTARESRLLSYRFPDRPGSYGPRAKTERSPDEAFATTARWRNHGSWTEGFTGQIHLMSTLRPSPRCRSGRGQTPRPSPRRAGGKGPSLGRNVSHVSTTGRLVVPLRSGRAPLRDRRSAPGGIGLTTRRLPPISSVAHACELVVGNRAQHWRG